MGNLKEKRSIADEITGKYPMDRLLTHRFFPVAAIEKLRRDNLVELACPMPKYVIADVGCESGHIESLLFTKCPNISKFYCIDASPRALFYATMRAKSDGWFSKSKFLVSDAEKLSLRNNVADVAISSHVLEHLENPYVAIRELARITKPTGRIIINLPNEAMLRALKRGLLTFLPEYFAGDLKVVTPGHLHNFTTGLLEEIARPFAIIEKMFLWPTPLLGLNIFAVLRPKKSSNQF